jgi:hypothetical protein
VRAVATVNGKPTRREQSAAYRLGGMRCAMSRPGLSGELPRDVTGLLVVTQAERTRVAQPSVPRPFGEPDLADESWTGPASRSLPDQVGEGGAADAQFVELPAQAQQGCPVQTRATLPA